MKHLFALLALLFALQAFAQRPSTSPSIVGKWVLVRHVLPDGRPAPTKGFYMDYSFRADGAYAMRTCAAGNDTCVTVGRWRMGPGGKEVLTTASRFLPPHDKDGLVGDHPLPVDRLDAAHVMLREHLFSEDRPGTSYFERR